MSDVARFAPPTPGRRRGVAPRSRWGTLVLAAGLTLGLLAPSPAGASKISSARAKAAALLAQINSINSKVEKLGQQYDQTQIALRRLNDQIANTRTTLANIQQHVAKGSDQLRQDVIFAYVTNGSASQTNPLFNTSAASIGATDVYTKLAEGNIASAIAGLKNYRIELTQERSKLAGEQAQAAAANNSAAKAFHQARALQQQLTATLRQVKGSIARYIAAAQAAAARKSAGQLHGAKRGKGVVPPPPSSLGNRAVRAAETFIGVPYVWGGASRGGVDCSGLVMLAYDMVGVRLSHYSGAQWDETMRVPLYDIRPGDLLFYGYHGDEHVAMYVGGGRMIEAEMTGTRVHVVPVRLGYGFAGLGRVRG